MNVSFHQVLYYRYLWSYDGLDCCCCCRQSVNTLGFVRYKGSHRCLILFLTSLWYCFDNYFTYFVPVFKYCYSDSRNL
jgi:hypothetical protein